MSNLTVDNLTVLGTVRFPDQSIQTSSSAQIFANTFGITRDGIQAATKINTDEVIFEKTLSVNQSVTTPILNSQSITFLNDLDSVGVYRKQNYAFTDTNRNDLTTTKNNLDSLIADHFDRPLKRIKINTTEGQLELDATYVDVQGTKLTQSNLTTPTTTFRLGNSSTSSRITLDSSSTNIYGATNGNSSIILPSTGIITVNPEISTTFMKPVTMSETLTTSTITAPIDLLINPTGDVNFNGKTLKMGGGQIHNCDKLISRLNTDIIVEGTGTSNIILKTNNIKAVTIENTPNISVQYPITFNNDTPASREMQLSSINFSNSTGTYGFSTRSKIFNLSNSLFLQNLNNSGTTDFEVRTAAGVAVAPLSMSATSLSVNRPLNMTDLAPANRIIYTSKLVLNEESGGYNSTALGQIYQTGSANYFMNLVNSGSINMVLKNATGTNIFAFQIFSNQVTLPAGINWNMSAGTGIISQGITAGQLEGNSLKRTSLSVNTGSTAGSQTSVLDLIDGQTNKGLFFHCNGLSGALGNTANTGDVVIGTRNENGGALCLTNYNSGVKNGIRIVANGNIHSVNILSGPNTAGNIAEFIMSYDKTSLAQTTTYNFPINFNPGGAIPAPRRLLNGLGTLSFTDVSGNTSTSTGGTATSSIYTDSVAVDSITGMYYKCGINSGSHVFSTQDSAGNITNPIYFSSGLTSVLNTFSIRNATTPSNRLDISTDATQVTTIRARSSTASTFGSININCDIVSALGVVTNTAVASITPSEISTVKMFSLRNATTPSNRLDFLADTSQNFVLEAKTGTDNTIANVHIDCQERGTEGSLFGGRVATFTPSSLTIRRPLQFQYITVPTLNTQLGYVLSPTSIFDSGISASASVQNVGSFSVPVTGTWMVQASVRLTGSANHTLTSFKAGINGFTATLPSLNSMYGMSLVGHQNISLSTTDTADFPMTSTIKIPSGGLAYVNVIINFSGGGSVNVKTSYALTRIG